MSLIVALKCLLELFKVYPCGQRKLQFCRARLGYIVTGFLNKETSIDTKINPILEEDVDDFAGPNSAYVPTKDANPMYDNQFEIEDSKWQNEISLDEEGIHLTNLALMDHKIIELEDLCRQSKTSDTDSSERDSTATYNGFLQLTNLHTTREKPIINQIKNYNKSDFCTTFLNLT